MARRIHARSILLQVQLGRAHGVGADELAALGLDADALAGADVMVSEAPVYAHLEAVAARTSFERFAVALAERHTLSSLGLVGLALRHAATGRDALARLERYQHLVNELAIQQVDESGAQAVWTEHRDGPRRLGRLLASEVTAATALHVMRGALGERFVADFVELPREDVDVAPYEEHFGAPILTGRPRARFGFARALLDRPMPSPDADALADLESVLESLDREKRARPAVVLDVRRALTAGMAAGATTVEDAARALHTSPRTLQRKLQDAGTTFADVLDELRLELATAYLARPELSVAEIAYLVGYREATAFHRAFRRWTNETPDAVRKRLGL
ncbi:AraC family transcriptional regulator [Myxococcota bacterium]|nr:AraC family transcriptional regulator [Myxococcota bacterium]